MSTDMTKYITSNYYRAEDIPPNVLIETTIVSIRDREFDENGETKVKPIIYTDQGKALVLNQTRLQALIAGFGHNDDNWIGRTILISRGRATYGTKEVAAVHVEAVVAERIGAEKRPTLEASTNAQPSQRGSTDIRSGKGAWDDGPPPESAPDGSNDPNDDIPF